jgi:acyl transferase domain-containing protein
LWLALGVTPAYVMGYSAGEVVAATVAGALSLVDAVDIRMARVKALMRASEPGGSALVFAPGEALDDVLAEVPDVSIAAYRGTASTVVAGWSAALTTFLDACQDKGLATQRLTVNHGLHSPWVEPVMPWLRGELENRRWSAPKGSPVPWLSTMTGKIQPPYTARQANYWCEQIRRPVRFAQSLQALSGLGAGMFIEVGPNTPLLALGRPILPSRQHVWLPSIRREAPDLKTLFESLGVLHTCGAQINVQAPEMIAGLDPQFSRIVS